MIEILNITAALLTIGFGAFGFIAPRFTMGALDLQTNGSTMGLSEIRASVGCLFVAIGVASLFLAEPWAYLMMGVAYAGAAFGRLVSMFIDKPPFKKATFYFVIEAILAGWLIFANT
jgi:hypothetical protein